MAVSPFYTIHRYRDDVFKVVAFKCVRDPDVALLRSEPKQHNNTKLSSNFSRARAMVLQYALCNPWEYFFTGTIDKTKYDRFSLDAYRSALTQWIRDVRKVLGTQVQYLIVPERHPTSGAWHVHGLLHGVPESELRPFRPPEPEKLIKRGYLNWERYQKKFGFCSLAPIRDPVRVAFYLAKYIGKDMTQRAGALGDHLYFHSRPLQKAERVSDVFAWDPQLEAICTEDYDFCKVGMIQDAPWYFPYIWEFADFYMDYIEGCAPAPAAPVIRTEDPPDFDPGEIDPFYEQLVLPGHQFSRRQLHE